MNHDVAQPRTVIVRCAAGISGVLAILPGIIAIRTYRPDCRILCVVSAEAAPILEKHPAVDGIVHDLEFLPFVKFLKSQSVDLVLLGIVCPFDVLAAMVAGVPWRIVVDLREMMGRTGRVIARLFRGVRSETDSVALNMLRLLGLPPRLPSRPWLVLKPRERRRARRRLRRIPGPLVLVDPACLSSATGLLRSRFSLVLAGLKAGPCQHPTLAHWRARVAMDFPDTLSLREWLAILIGADVLVSVDDTSLRLADAMGSPAVRLAPPRQGEGTPVLPEAVAWQVEAVLRHRLRIVGRSEAHHAGAI